MERVLNHAGGEGSASILSLGLAPCLMWLVGQPTSSVESSAHVELSVVLGCNVSGRAMFLRGDVASTALVDVFSFLLQWVPVASFRSGLFSCR